MAGAREPVKILHAAAQDRDRKRLEDYAGLRGALCVLYGSVCRAAQLDDTGGDTLRVTLHRVVRPAKKGVAAETLEQLLPYIGGKGGPAGRTFSIRSGVIGKAAREKMPVAVERGSQAYPDFVHELIRDWAYTEEDAREISSDRQAWMAVPIVIANAELTAVVSLDSSIRGFFTDHVQHAVLGCCRGITDYIVEVY